MGSFFAAYPDKGLTKGILPPLYKNPNEGDGGLLVLSVWWSRKKGVYCILQNIKYLERMRRLILLPISCILAGVGYTYAEEMLPTSSRMECSHRQPEGYSKDSWTVYYKGEKVDGASSSSFESLGGGYGKDNWNVYFKGEKVPGASPATFRVPSR